MINNFLGTFGVLRLLSPPSSLSNMSVNYVNREKFSHGDGFKTSSIPLQVCLEALFHISY